MIKLGQSSRDYVVMGPDDRMPVEGASKAQRLEERLLKVPPTPPAPLSLPNPAPHPGAESPLLCPIDHPAENALMPQWLPRGIPIN